MNKSLRFPFGLIVLIVGLLGVLFCPPVPSVANGNQFVESSTTKPITVVVSIKPLYSLVSLVTGGVNTNLIVKGDTSPHHINLSAKNIQTINNADAVFVISKDLERPICHSVKHKEKLYQAINFKNIQLLNLDNSKFIISKKHNHNKRSVNRHIWLSVKNAIVIVNQVADILSEKDPKNATFYQNNARSAVEKLKTLNTYIKKRLNHKIAPFLLYHNGFAYFENEYNVHAAGIINSSLNVSHNFRNGLSAKSLINLGDFISKHNIKYVFIEPQLQDRTLLKYLQSNNIVYREIDPIGFKMTPNQDLYFTLMQNIADTIAECK